MNDTVAVLMARIQGVDPVAKYVLARSISYFSTESGNGMPAREWAGSIGISEGQLFKALKNLRQLNVISVCPETDGLGRSKIKRYLLTEEFSEALKQGVGDALHQHAVEWMLLHPSKATVSNRNGKEPIDLAKEERGKKGSLSVVNRVLLATLLCHADEFGCVTDVSHADLAELIGIETSRIKYRLQVLMRKAFICKTIPGVSSPLLSKKFKTIYFLNVNSTSFQFVKRHISISSPVRTFFSRSYSGIAHFHPDARKYFGKELFRIAEVLEALVCKYGSYLLNMEREDLKGSYREFDNKKLKEKVNADFRKPEFKPVKKQDNVSEYNFAFDALIDGVQSIAYDRARWIKINMIDGFDKVSLEGLKLSVYPSYCSKVKEYKDVRLLVSTTGDEGCANYSLGSDQCLSLE